MISEAQIRALEKPRIREEWAKIGLILGVKPVTLTSDVKQKNKEVNTIDPKPNNSYKTKKNLTGFYTEVNPKIGLAALIKFAFMLSKTIILKTYARHFKEECCDYILRLK